jgi:hypothetical protein
MRRFYRVAVEKHPVGSAIEFREPPLEGEVVVKVSEAATQGASRVVVLDADDEQDERNRTLAGVEALDEEAAVALSAEYQPASSGTRFDPATRKTEEVETPAVDLARILAER